MSTIASQITSLTIVFPTVYSDTDQRKHQRRRSKKSSKLRVVGLCAGNSPGTGEFPAQKASNAENIPFDDAIMRKSPKSLMWHGRSCRNYTHKWLGFKYGNIGCASVSNTMYVLFIDCKIGFYHFICFRQNPYSALMVIFGFLLSTINVIGVVDGWYWLCYSLRLI